VACFATRCSGWPAWVDMSRMQAGAQSSLCRVCNDSCVADTAHCQAVFAFLSGCCLRLVPCAGLPESALELAAQSARNDGHEGATPEAGPWQFGLDMPSLFPVLSHAKNRRALHWQHLGVFMRLGRRVAPHPLLPLTKSISDASCQRCAPDALFRTAILKESLPAASQTWATVFCVCPDNLQMQLLLVRHSRGQPQTTNMGSHSRARHAHRLFG